MARYLDLVFDVPLKRSYTYLSDEKGLACVGKRVMASFGRRDMAGFVVGERDTLEEKIEASALKTIRRVIDAEPLFGPAQIELARWIAGYYLCSTGEALAMMLPSGRRETSVPGMVQEEADVSAQPLELSAEQRAAVDALTGVADATADRRPHYLYGITGSGKTEVFLRAAESVIARGQTVIYLVPEISLTHQLVENLETRFGKLAASLHSGLSGSQKLSEWQRIRSGEARIVVGPRSAIFAPLSNLGLVIIDEEQDGSYKSGNTPRYHARQVAMKLCAAAGARLVMGSATPSVEAWKLMRDGQFKRLDLSHRLSGGAPAQIRAIDLNCSEGLLSRELQEEIRACAQAGRQTILFLNRRGFSHFYHCRQCGYELSCRQCSVSLTYHKSRGRAICHYCGYSQAIPSSCPQCGSLEAAFSGFGTEQVEETVTRTFPDLRVARVDTDSIGPKGSLKRVLDEFRAGHIDILLGTQMVAKGLNFPLVRLVGVVLADSALQLPDFRAAERTFSLIVQVAGRAGRYFPDGRVLVQTLRPGEDAIAKACALDIDGFYDAELRQRESLGFPPYSRLIRVVCRSKDPEKARQGLGRLIAALRPRLPDAAQLLGPAECPLAIIAGNHRMHLLLRSKDLSTIHGPLRQALEQWSETRDSSCHLEVDVDPVSLL